MRAPAASEKNPARLPAKALHWSVGHDAPTAGRALMRSAPCLISGRLETQVPLGASPYEATRSPGTPGAFCRLELQRKRPDCGITSPVIAALGGQNANRQSEQERGGDSDYAFGCHHRSPQGF